MTAARPSSRRVHLGRQKQFLHAHVDVLGHTAGQCGECRNDDFATRVRIGRRLGAPKGRPVGVAGDIHSRAGGHAGEVAPTPVRAGTGQAEWRDAHPDGLGGSAITAEVGEDHVHSRPETVVQGRNDRGAGPFDAPTDVLGRALGFECDHVGSEVGEGAAGQTRPLVGQVKDAQILEQARHGRQPRAPPIFADVKRIA